MSLEDQLIYRISTAIYKSLNEMSRNINYRTIDRKLWLSVASICSRNRSTEAEFVKPMKKLTKEDLINRYVAALLIMKKPCPQTEEDIETLKTLKLFGQKAIQLGANIRDIKDCYIQNSNSTNQAPITATQQEETTNKSNIFDEVLNGGDDEDTIAKVTVDSRIKDFIESKVDSKIKNDDYYSSIYKNYKTNHLSCYDKGYSYNDLTDNGYTSVLFAKYVFTDDTNENEKVYITNYKHYIVNGDEDNPTVLKPVKLSTSNRHVIKYCPRSLSENEARHDYNGPKNTVICKLNANVIDGIKIPDRYWYNDVVYETYKRRYLDTTDVYIPALGELIITFLVSDLLDDMKGKIIWSSTFKDPEHVYGYDGYNVKVLNIKQDSAYIVPYFRTYSELRETPNILNIKYLGYIIRDHANEYIAQNLNILLQQAQSWNLPIIDSEINKIEKEVKYMSNAVKQTKIITLLNNGRGNFKDEKQFTYQYIYENNWNMKVYGMIYKDNKLYVKYWTSDGSIEADGLININDLVGQHRDKTARTKFSFDETAKTQILNRSCTLLMYWDSQIRKYQK